MPDIDLLSTLARLATTADLRRELREEGDRLREHMTVCIERVSRDIHALIDAIEFMTCIDSEARQHGTGPAD
jgi:hypothetical protein